MSEKWSVESPRVRGSRRYLVRDQNDRPVASVYDQGNAHLIASLPQLKEVRYEYAQIINRLACIVQENATTQNDIDYAQEMIDMVGPFLGCAEIGY